MKKAYISPAMKVVEIAGKNYCLTYGSGEVIEGLVKGNSGSDEGGGSFDTGGIWDTEW